jgi:hypothetical protein
MGSIILPIYKKGYKTDCSNYRGISLFPTTYKNVSKILPSILIPYSEEIIGDHQCGFDATGQQLIIYTAFVKQLRRKGNTMKQCLSYLCFKKVYYSVRREVLYDIIIEFGIP